jgi:uncharacterized protein (DUF488 family)
VGRLYTVGHSTRTSEELLALLGGAGVRRLVDVRRQPGSRRHPRFAQAALRQALARADIAYAHEPDLGGRRDPRAGSPNTAWRHAAFRGYADHMATPAFQEALDRTLRAAAEAPSAVLCAEALPERCHRQLIADAAVLAGFEVVHLIGPAASRPHGLHRAAHRRPDGTLVYPSPGEQAVLFPGSGPRAL